MAETTVGSTNTEWDEFLTQAPEQDCPDLIEEFERAFADANLKPSDDTLVVRIF